MRRPHFIAEQARHARGPIGRLVASIMARETWTQNLQAIDALDLQPADHVLDIGCGHGRSLSALAARTPRGHVTGADPSDLMAAIASRRNRGLIRAGRASVRRMAPDALPFPDGAFHKILCVHVVYFQPDLDRSFCEIARVLRPGGRLALVFRSSADTAAVNSFPPDIYRFRPAEGVVAALRGAGLVVEAPPRDEAGPLLAVASKPAA